MPVFNRSSLASKIADLERRHDNDWPLWAGPCGEGQLGGITQSMIVRFLSCRERFRLRYVLGLEPHDRWNHRLGYGNMWHVCEEELAKYHEPNNANEPVWYNALLRHSQDQTNKYPLQHDDILKWMHVCMVQFPEYVKYWGEHPDVLNRTPLMQEQVFDVPYTLPSGRTVRLRGKFDSVDLIEAHRDWQGREWPTGIYLQENKTKSDIDQLQVERQLKFDLQTMLYLVALRLDLHYKTQLQSFPPVLGVRYNVVRRPLSGGRGNISPHKEKATKTKFTPAETADEFYERLRRDYLADDPGYWFFRVRSEVSSQNIQVFLKTCLEPLLETICDWYNRCCPNQCDHRSETDNSGISYRTPFGVYSTLEESGSTEYDAFLESGSESGLRRTEQLFTELQ